MLLKKAYLELCRLSGGTSIFNLKNVGSNTGRAPMDIIFEKKMCVLKRAKIGMISIS